MAVHELVITRQQGEAMRAERAFTDFFEKEIAAKRSQWAGRVKAALARIARQGPSPNRERFIHEQDGIYAIKEHQVRIYCFFDHDNSLVITNCVIKKKPRADSAWLKKARERRQKYLESRARSS